MYIQYGTWRKVPWKKSPHVTLCGKNFSSAPISIRLCILRFFGALITYLLSDFRNSKWRTQHGGRKSSNSTNFRKTRYLGVFCNAYHESIVRFSKFKMADPIWRTQKSKFNLFSWNLVPRDFLYRWSWILADFWNSKWRIQYGGRKSPKSTNFPWN